MIKYIEVNKNGEKIEHKSRQEVCNKTGFTPEQIVNRDPEFMHEGSYYYKAKVREIVNPISYREMLKNKAKEIEQEIRDINRIFEINGVEK